MRLSISEAHITHCAGLIKARPLDEWRETMAILCSFSSSDEWSGLCDALARMYATSEGPSLMVEV